jgi:hypothetical protein
MSDEKELKQEKKPEKKEMSLAEARAYRASLYKAQPVKLSDQEKREQFRIYWAENKSKYGKAKELESILWVHLKAVKLDDPEKFEAGIAHFGLKKIR